MGITANDSILSIQGLVGDPNGDYATPEYVLGYMRTAQKGLINTLLSLPTLGRAVMLVDVPSIGAVGVRDLSALFLPGGLLELLEDPIQLWERDTNSSNEDDWSEMSPTYVPSPRNPGSLNRVYTWTGSTLLVPGADQDLQLRVYGAFKPSPLVAVDSPMVPGTDTCIEFKTAELICRVRGARALAADHRADFDLQVEGYVNRIVQHLQAAPIRQKSFSGRGRRH
jgi:hypothetical protein